MSVRDRNARQQAAREPFFMLWCIRLAAVPCLTLALSSASSQTVGRHPDRRFVDESVPATHTLRLEGPRAQAPAILGDATATIGREDGPDHFIFGEITDLKVTPQGTVVVVDRQTQDVRLFDSRGLFLQRLGRPGQGPGEFRAPHSLLVTPDSEIWVADMQRRITVFKPSTDGYRLARTLPVEIGIRSMCYLGGELVANAVSISDPYVIRVLDASARPLRSFGSVYSSPNAYINYQFAEGRIACDTTNDLIVYASQAALGEIRAWHRDGKPAWRTVIEDVRVNIITDNEGGGVNVERSPGGVHSLVALNVVPGVGVLLQYSFRTSAQLAAREPGDILTIVLDPKTGAGSLTSASWPRLGAWSRNQVFALADDPAPRIEVRELKRQ